MILRVNLWNQHSYLHFIKGELKEVQKDALVFLEEVTVEAHVKNQFFMITKPLPFPLNHYFTVILIFLFYPYYVNMTVSLHTL